MRILHTSDWHLGRVLHEFPLLEDQRQVLGQLIAHCRTGAYDALLIAGDVFDRSLASEEAVRLWSGFLRDLRADCPDLPLLVIAGNHDSATRIAYAADALALAKIHVRGGPDALETPVEIRDAAGSRMQVWMIPFLWAGDCDGGGGDRRIRTQEETLAAAVERIRPLQDPGAVQVAMAHCFARGALASDSERVLVGTATDVEAALFASFDYTALGHLHRGQRVLDGVWYSGSPLPYSFSETGDPKAVLAVELAMGRSPAVTQLPLHPPHPLRRLRGGLRELLEDPAFAAHTDSFVEIALDPRDAGANPFALLKGRFPFLLHLCYLDPEAGEAAEGAPLAERAGDLLSDYRQFVADLGLEDDALERRTALAALLAAELARQETA